MPEMTARDAPDAQGQKIVLLNSGESTTGKTGALASLIADGYRLRVLDFDGKSDILRSFIPREAPSGSVRYVRCTDRPANVAGLPKYGDPTAFGVATAALDARTKDDPNSPWLGENPDEWGLDTVLVLDTLNTFSAAVRRKVQKLNGRLNAKAERDDYASIGDLTMNFVQMILGMQCHVIVNSHIKYIAENDAKGLPARVRPAAEGNVVSDNIGTYFPNQIVTKLSGRGANAKRVLSTVYDGTLPVATTSPLTVKSEYELGDGMAKLFADLGARAPKGAQEIKAA